MSQRELNRADHRAVKVLESFVQESMEAFTLGVYVSPVDYMKKIKIIYEKGE